MELARKAVACVPDDGVSWNTLGVALCRAGDWQEALRALEKSLELSDGGAAADWSSCANWLFRTVACCHLGEEERARAWFEKAEAWIREHGPADEELARFRAEAAELLGE